MIFWICETQIKDATTIGQMPISQMTIGPKCEGYKGTFWMRFSRESLLMGKALKVDILNEIGCLVKRKNTVTV
jgi:hypothetical protein